MRLVQVNQLTYPFKCCGCASESRELAWLALDIFVEGYGDLFLCENCLNTTERLLERGLVFDLETKVADLEKQNEEGNRALIAYRSISDAFALADLVFDESDSKSKQGTAGTKKSATV